jgi:hypothetical protein
MVRYIFMHSLITGSDIVLQPRIFHSSSLYGGMYDHFPVPNFRKSGDLDFAIHRGIYPFTCERMAGSDAGLIQSYQGTELKT